MKNAKDGKQEKHFLNHNVRQLIYEWFDTPFLVDKLMWLSKTERGETPSTAGSSMPTSSNLKVMLSWASRLNERFDLVFMLVHLILFSSFRLKA